MIKKWILTCVMMVMPLSAIAAANEHFSLKSGDLVDGKVMPINQVFNNFGCTGKNISPELKWANAPKGTQSFAITVYDPDAPTGSGWWHWTVFNIPASVTEIAQGASLDKKKMPQGAVEGRTDFGSPGYGGACPPVGDKAHHYHVTVYALKVPKLELDTNASGAMIGYYLNQNTLAKAQLTVTYGR